MWRDLYSSFMKLGGDRQRNRQQGARHHQPTNGKGVSGVRSIVKTTTTSNGNGSASPRSPIGTGVGGGGAKRPPLVNNGNGGHRSQPQQGNSSYNNNNSQRTRALTNGVNHHGMSATTAPAAGAPASPKLEDEWDKDGWDDDQDDGWERKTTSTSPPVRVVFLRSHARSPHRDRAQNKKPPTPAPATPPRASFFFFGWSCMGI